jgi:succinyldiaminopimelate transaminase
MSNINEITQNLKPYPMEELTKIKAGLVKAGKPVFDFGTGDPRIPTWAPIRDAIVKAIPEISQYPSVKGSEALREAQWGYLNRRFGIRKSDSIAIIPSQGSKEAIFNVALCLVNRESKKRHIIYPDPGYPVYRSSALFAGGIPYPVRINAEDGYLLKPWELPSDIQNTAAAIWVNYPHNPTGAIANYSYWKQMVDWCHKTDTVLLSDDCYIDIYDEKLDINPSLDPTKDKRPLCPLQISSDRVVTFMSLSKRSGLTGYRSGLVAGDPKIIGPWLQARASFGVGSPDFIQAGAIVAWADDTHVAERRKIFSHRLRLAMPYLKKLGLIEAAPEAGFCLWCKVPPSFKGDDVGFVLKLAELGIITSPSSWLSEGISGYFRIALVPGDEQTVEAMEKLSKFVSAGA